MTSPPPAPSPRRCCLCSDLRASLGGSLLLRRGDVGVVRNAPERDQTADYVVPRHRNFEQEPSEEKDEYRLHVADDLKGERAKGADAHVLRNIHPDGEQARGDEKEQRLLRPVIVRDKAPRDRLIEERTNEEHRRRHERRRAPEQVVRPNAVFNLQPTHKDLLSARREHAYHGHDRSPEIDRRLLHRGDADANHDYPNGARERPRNLLTEKRELQHRNRRYLQEFTQLVKPHVIHHQRQVERDDAHRCDGDERSQPFTRKISTSRRRLPARLLVPARERPHGRGAEKVQSTQRRRVLKRQPGRSHELFIHHHDGD